MKKKKIKKLFEEFIRTLDAVETKEWWCSDSFLGKEVYSWFCDWLDSRWYHRSYNGTKGTPDNKGNKMLEEKFFQIGNKAINASAITCVVFDHEHKSATLYFPGEENPAFVLHLKEYEIFFKWYSDQGVPVLTET